MPTALITGSAKGMGKAMALALAKDGYDVAIHYLNSREAANSTAEKAGQAGVKAMIFQADLRKQEEAKKLITDVHKHFGSLEVLINNVGNYHKSKLSELESRDWQEMLNSNLNSSFYCSQAALPIMRENRFGRIINFGFAGSEYISAKPSIVAYQIAKTGVIIYSKALAKEEAKNGITVNVISPGVIETSISKPLTEIPMQRLGKVAEIVAAMRYFLSDVANYTTGTTLEIAGGWNL